ncbi:MAG: hypothetical protein HAW62_06290 [Endozoicomonadaceae bacterium]|nr:hypothetical protein [Endozoicomonadaceae bacterium]
MRPVISIILISSAYFFNILFMLNHFSVVAGRETPYSINEKIDPEDASLVRIMLDLCFESTEVDAHMQFQACLQKAETLHLFQNTVFLKKLEFSFRPWMFSMLQTNQSKTVDIDMLKSLMSKIYSDHMSLFDSQHYLNNISPIIEHAQPIVGHPDHTINIETILQCISCIIDTGHEVYGTPFIITFIQKTRNSLIHKIKTSNTLKALDEFLYKQEVILNTQTSDAGPSVDTSNDSFHIAATPRQQEAKGLFLNIIKSESDGSTTQDDINMRLKQLGASDPEIQSIYLTHIDVINRKGKKIGKMTSNGIFSTNGQILSDLLLKKDDILKLKKAYMSSTEPKKAEWQQEYSKSYNSEILKKLREYNAEITAEIKNFNTQIRDINTKLREEITRPEESLSEKDAKNLLILALTLEDVVIYQNLMQHNKIKRKQYKAEIISEIFNTILNSSSILFHDLFWYPDVFLFSLNYIEGFFEIANKSKIPAQASLILMKPTNDASDINEMLSNFQPTIPYATVTQEKITHITPTVLLKYIL